MRDELLHQQVRELAAKVMALNDRIRDLERHAQQSTKLAPYKEDDAPITSRSPVAQAVGAKPDYYNGRPRQ